MQDALPLYACKECGVAVVIRPGHGPIRGCLHDGAPIVGNISATAYGLAGLEMKGYKQIPTKEEVEASGV